MPRPVPKIGSEGPRTPRATTQSKAVRNVFAPSQNLIAAPLRKQKDKHGTNNTMVAA